MPRPMRRPARDRVRRRPLYETLEGRYSAGSLLAGPVLGGIALASARPAEPVAGDDAVGLARAKDRVPAVTAPRRPAAGAISFPRSIVPARVDSTRMPTLLRSPLAAADRPEDQGPLMARDAA